MESKICLTCNNLFSRKKSTWFKKAKFCSMKCFHLSREQNLPKCKECNQKCKAYDREYCSNFCAKKSIMLPSNLSKGDLFLKRKTWQSARTAIRKHAARVFANHYKYTECICCGYSKHVEVCHIKPVAEFDDSCTILEINNILNLVGLCPTHHWEFDNKQMSSENISKIVKI